MGVGDPRGGVRGLVGCRRALDAMAAGCLRRTVEILQDKWVDVERIAARLDDEGAVTVR